MSRRKGRSGSSEWTERPTTTDSSLVINWMGSSFRISEKVGILPLMEFASLSAQDVDTSDMGALAAMYELLKQCIDDRDWQGFRKKALESRAGTDDIFDAVTKTLTVLGNR